MFWVSRRWAGEEDKVALEEDWAEAEQRCSEMQLWWYRSHSFQSRRSDWCAEYEKSCGQESQAPSMEQKMVWRQICGFSLMPGRCLRPMQEQLEWWRVGVLLKQHNDGDSASKVKVKRYGGMKHEYEQSTHGSASKAVSGE
jgi:hypothetical protein